MGGVIPDVCEIVEVDVPNCGDFLRIGCCCGEDDDCQRDSSNVSHEVVVLKRK